LKSLTFQSGSKPIANNSNNSTDSTTTNNATTHATKIDPVQLKENEAIKSDTNCLVVDFTCLQDGAVMPATGDPFLCTKCGAVFVCYELNGD
jgi:hypothetical protein